MQNLIYPINDSTITACYLNDNYVTDKLANGAKHYGVDMFGTAQDIWCQGNGVVLQAGSSNCYGFFVTVLYSNVQGTNFDGVIASYYHLRERSGLTPGQLVTIDHRIGYQGKTGTYATGVHLHLQMREWRGETKLFDPFNVSPFVLNTNGWFNPLDIMCLKLSAPEKQKRAFANNRYINLADKQYKPKEVY